MRKFDKTKNLNKANILAEQRYLVSKGLISENERTSMSEFLGDVTDNVDTLLKMFSKYEPNNSWFMTVGYVNNADFNATIKNDQLERLEGLARQLNSPIFNHMIESDAWREAKANSKGFKNPYAGGQKTDKETKVVTKIPTKVYSTKSFMIQWGNIRSKSDKDAAVKSVYDKHGIPWPEGGEIDVNDKRGSGWDAIQGTPFSQHQGTGTKRLAFYSKVENVKSSKSKFFLNFEGEIKELIPEEQNFLFNELSTKSNESKIPKRLLDMENQEAAQEIFAMESAYQMRSLNLDKISYIRCAMNVDGENKKFSYINKNAVPDGLAPGDFAQIINPA